jgi:hypothetical protein
MLAVLCFQHFLLLFVVFLVPQELVKVAIYFQLLQLVKRAYLLEFVVENIRKGFVGFVEGGAIEERRGFGIMGLASILVEALLEGEYARE